MRKLYRAVLFYCIAPLVLTCAAAGPESDATRLINEALERSGGNKNQAAKILRLNRTTLVEKLKKRAKADNES